MGETRSAFKILVRKPLRRMRRKWQDNIKTDLGEIGCEVWRWMELAKDCVHWWALVLAELLPGR
jgi:hypothetical protein